MSSSSVSSNDRSGHRMRGRCGGSNWSGLNIAAMVVGFVLFWPVGLFVLVWILAGQDVRDVPQWLHRQWSKVMQMWQGGDGLSKGERSGNPVFNEFQQTQYDRIREIKDEIKERSRRFSEFREKAKRRADEDEFNRFMADAPGRADM